MLHYAGRIDIGVIARQRVQVPRRRTWGKASKRRFADAALALSKAFSLSNTLEEAKAVRDDQLLRHPTSLPDR